MTIRTYADIQRMRIQGALTSAEKTLIANCRAGVPTTLADGSLPDGPSDARTVGADLLRYLITGGCRKFPMQDSGLDLTGAYVIGGLDLNFSTAKGATGLFDCRFEKPIGALQTKFEFLTLNGSHLPGLMAQGARVTGGVSLHLATATDEVSLSGARIGGQLICAGAHFENAEGLAFNAQEVQVTGGVFLQEIEVEGEKKRFEAKGGVHLSGAKISGQLSCSGAHFENAGDKALNAEFIQVTGNVVLCKVTAIGEVSFSAAAIDGSLSFERSQFSNETRKALNLQKAKVKGGFLWREIVNITGLIDVNGAHVADLVDDAASWELVDELHLNRFRYDRIQGPMNAFMRLKWLRNGSFHQGEFWPQPYEQLAHVFMAMGHEADSRRVRIEKENLQRADERKRMRGALGSVQRARKRVTDFLSWLVVGYGYRPFRALYLFLVLWVIGSGISYQAWHAGDFAPNSDVILSTPEWQVLAAEGTDVDNPAKAWSAKYGAGRDWETFSAGAYAFDVVVPIVMIGQTEAWAPSTTRGHWGWHLWWARWVLTVLGWIVTAVGAAAITGIIRRE